jgi:hypothetical protein
MSRDIKYFTCNKLLEEPSMAPKYAVNTLLPYYILADEAIILTKEKTDAWFSEYCFDGYTIPIDVAKQLLQEDKSMCDIYEFIKNSDDKFLVLMPF